MDAANWGEFCATNQKPLPIQHVQSAIALPIALRTSNNNNIKLDIELGEELGKIMNRSQTPAP